MMRIHCLQHVPFESPEQIAVWAARQGHPLTTTLLYEDDKLPSLEDYDLLVIMGGPMGVYDETIIPWLRAEKVFIREAIAAGKLVLGICLGAQLIAEVLGGEVTRNPWREIGWFPVQLTEEARSSVFFPDFPEAFTPFHWHGDTFSLPPGASRLAFSSGCANQAFEYNHHVLGLQFHLECNEESIAKIIQNSEDEMVPDLYVQEASDMLGQKNLVSGSNDLMFGLLARLEKRHLAAQQ